MWRREPFDRNLISADLKLSELGNSQEIFHQWFGVYHSETYLAVAAEQ